jgi:hypothetical protein
MGIKWLSCIPRVVELTAPRYVDRFFGGPATLEVLGDFAKLIEKNKCFYFFDERDAADFDVAPHALRIIISVVFSQSSILITRISLSLPLRRSRSNLMGLRLHFRRHRSVIVSPEWVSLMDVSLSTVSVKVPTGS